MVEIPNFAKISHRLRLTAVPLTALLLFAGA
jgi:hypothetical protein